MNSPKYTKLLTPEEYEKLTLDEKAEYITAMATVLKSRLPARDPPQDAANGQGDPPGGNATGEAHDDPPAGTATNQTQEDPPPSNDKPNES